MELGRTHIGSQSYQCSKGTQAQDNFQWALGDEHSSPVSDLLSINSLKTQLLNFYISDRFTPACSFPLDGSPIHPRKKKLFLYWSWMKNLHIADISLVSSGIFAFHSLAKISNWDVLLSVYYDLIFPHLVYTLPRWGRENKRTIFLFRLKKGNQSSFLYE